MLVEPIKEYIEEIQREIPGSFVHVIMGQLVMNNFMEQALHQNSASIFGRALSGMERVVVTSVPYQIYKVTASVDIPWHEFVAEEASPS